MFALIRAGFNQRRKTLKNSLDNWGGLSLTKEQIGQGIESLGMGPSVRGEALSLEQFAALADYFSGLGDTEEKGLA